MPENNKAHIDRALTNMSVAYIQDENKYIADKVFPIVKVTKQSDLYFIYNKGDFFRDEAQERGRLGESAGGDYDLDSEGYFCKINAFHKDVSPQDRVNYDVPLDADKDAQIFVTQKMLIRREMTWADNFFKSGVWGTEVEGVAASPTGDQTIFWNLDTSDPIKDMSNASVRMAEATGYKPNKVVMSPYVYSVLANHFDILDRIKYTEKGIVTTDLLASLFDVDEVLVSWAVVNHGKKGAADDMQFISGKSALLCYSNPTPALRAPSAGYIMAWTGLEGAGAYGNRIVRLPMDMLGLGTERIEGEMAFDAKCVAKDLGVFFNGIVQ